MNRKYFIPLILIFCIALVVFGYNAIEVRNSSGDGNLPLTIYYPSEIKTSIQDGNIHLEKIYILKTNDDPMLIPTSDFKQEGYRYTFLDLLKADQTKTGTKQYSEALTIDSNTQDMTEILKLLPAELQIKTEDGYIGEAKLNHTSINVAAKGFASKSYTVTASHSYPNLSDADTSLIPKTVTENGRTLTLSDVGWQTAASSNFDGYDVADRYTALATYTGSATGKYATGYTVAAEYTGNVTKTECDTVMYTAIFSAHTGVNIKYFSLPLAMLFCILGYFAYRYFEENKRKKGFLL